MLTGPSGEAEAVRVGFECGDHVGDDFVQRHGELFRTAYDLFAIDCAGEGLVLHFLFDRGKIDIMDTFGWPNERDGDDKTAELIDRPERFLQSDLRINARVIGVGKNRATNFFTPAVVAQPRDADKRMAFGRAAFQVRVPFVIHVVQQTDCFPKIDIFAAQLRKVFHRIRDGVGMLAQTFGLDPFLKDGKGAFSLGHGKEIKKYERKAKP